MELTLDWKNMFYIGSQFIGYSVAIVLIVAGFRRNRVNLLIGLAFLILTYSAFVAGLVSSGLFVHFPALYRSGNLVALLFAPVVYLYLQAVIRKTKLTAWDLLHLLPALVYLVDYWPVFVLPVSEKLSLIQAEIEDPVLFTMYRQTRFFPDNFYTPFRTVQIAVYWLFSVRLVYQYSKTATRRIKYFGRDWLAWIKLFLGAMALIFLPFFATFWLLDAKVIFDMVHAVSGIMATFTGIALLFYPNILYGLNAADGEFQPGKQSISPKAEKPVRVIQLSSEKESTIRKKLEGVMNEKKVYLKRGYTVHALAADTGIPEYLLTEYIQRSLKTTFPDLINEQRIAESCRLIASGAHEQYSIDGIAELSGFSNRNSYIMAFRKFKNSTPSEYIRSAKAGKAGA